MDDLIIEIVRWNQCRRRGRSFGAASVAIVAAGPILAGPNERLTMTSAASATSTARSLEAPPPPASLPVSLDSDHLGGREERSATFKELGEWRVRAGCAQLERRRRRRIAASAPNHRKRMKCK